MGLKGAEAIVLFDFFLVFLLVQYGASTGIVTVPNYGVGFPRLAPLPPSFACQFWDLGCTASSVATATAYIGWAIVNMPVIFIYFLGVVITFLNLGFAVIFNPAFGTNGVPIVGFFFTALQIIVLFELIRIFRGSATGL